ncbi:glycosyltransferase [SAR86 cluster bacterium]|nr:glycosyltransferase [SAR86 cluster bacterium]
MKNNYLFNFSVSWTGGGLKRLYAYSEWFDKKGGTNFIVHPTCSNFIDLYPNNKYFIVKQSKLSRLFKDSSYLQEILTKLDNLDMYYSYGIPIYSRVCKVNWFHLSSVTPLLALNMDLSIFNKIKYSILGMKIKRNLKHADHISAESNFSLGLLKDIDENKLILSVHGSDDELKYLDQNIDDKKENIAITVGTHTYKRLDLVYSKFLELKENNNELKLFVIGEKNNIPSYILQDKQVEATGTIPRKKVIEFLIRARYFITASSVENSYNAASEGIFLATESFISDISPHMELVKGMPYTHSPIQNSNIAFLQISRSDLSSSNIATWDQVLVDLLKHVNALS